MQLEYNLQHRIQLYEFKQYSAITYVFKQLCIYNNTTIVANIWRELRRENIKSMDVSTEIE